MSLPTHKHICFNYILKPKRGIATPYLMEQQSHQPLPCFWFPSFAFMWSCFQANFVGRAQFEQMRKCSLPEKIQRRHQVASSCISGQDCWCSDSCLSWALGTPMQCDKCIKHHQMHFDMLSERHCNEVKPGECVLNWLEPWQWDPFEVVNAKGQRMHFFSSFWWIIASWANEEPQGASQAHQKPPRGCSWTSFERSCTVLPCNTSWAIYHELSILSYLSWTMPGGTEAAHQKQSMGWFWTS